MNLDNRLSLADSRQSAPVAVDDIQRVPVESKFLARGAAADVWLAPSADIHGRKHVIKIFRVDLRTLQDHCNPRGSRTAEQLWSDFIQTLRLKVEIWEALRHDNIVGVLGIHEEPDLRVEFCASGAASRYLEKHLDDHIRLRKRMILDLLAGIVYLHSQKPPVVHGCICMDKLLVDSQGRTKVSEFGLASLVERFGLFAPSISQSNRTRWLSPELLDTDADEQPPVCTTESDIWALGCTLFEIMSGKLPYFKLKHDLRVQREILSKKPPGRQDSCLAPEFVPFWLLLTQCWSWAPEQRPVADSPDNSILLLLSTQRIPPEQVRESALPGIPPPLDAQAEVFTISPSNDISNIIVVEPKIPAVPHSLMMDPFLPVSISEKSLTSSYSAWKPPSLEDIGALPRVFPGRARPIEPDIEHAYNATRYPSGKRKWTRACIRYRKYKSECRLDSQGAMKCERCQASGSECRFVDSRRGKEPKFVLDQLNSSDEEQDVVPTNKGKSRAEFRPLGSQKQSEDSSILEHEVLYSESTVGPEVISEGQAVPKILALRIITDEEAEHLFQIFHQKLDPSIGIIDPRIHNMMRIKSRSEILFTAICAIASRYWTERPDAYTMLMPYTQTAVQVSLDGPKSIESCQALLLLSIYHPPTQNWEDDRSWLYLGHAIRLAQDLQLNTWDAKAYFGETEDPEVLNGARTWLLCFKMDCELATFYGRPATILSDRITQSPSDWWRSPKYDGCLDAQLSDDTQLSSLTNHYWSLLCPDSNDSGESDNDAISRSSILDAFENDLSSLEQRVVRANSMDAEPSILSFQYRATLSIYAANLYQTSRKIAYHRLRISSFRLENAYQSVSESRSVILSQSFSAASEVLRVTNEDMLTHEFYRYAPNIDWIPSVHTAVFLIKLARPRNPRPSELILSQVQREEALSLIRKFIFTLEMNAVDARHTLAVYARLLTYSLGEHERTTMGDAPDPETLSFAPGLENLGWEVSLLLGMSTLNGGFWDNLLLPGMM
ncbi:unnamed protein product [Rhizoctonia solani]|uniref:Protein kinase domain-containing protein n=1 Tax=Rhizoctonia solani TaxID=456999 RepID=A0A8H3H747_9AGAM|nr:unnamed protein product [Rhizoctonia solani]